MTPLPGWGCPVCGILLLTLAEIEAHQIHALPVEHVRVEVVEQSIGSTDVTAALPAPSPPSPPLTSWGANNAATDVALRRSSRWHPAYYADFGSSAAVILAAVEAESHNAA